MVSADGSYATYRDSDQPDASAKGHLDELSDCIAYLEQQNFAKPLVHIIDREGDSIGHIRRWESGGSHWLVRAKDNPTLEYQDQTMACKPIAKQLDYQKTRQVTYHGKTYWQWTAEADVTITRAAKPSQKKGKKPQVPGEPIKARLVVSRILSDTGEQLAEWLLLTNVEDIDASIIALWYYWRWQIESFFKLMKSAGHQLEAWQQESALAIAKRLLVASMACVTVWAIATDKSQEAADLRAFLVKLSGRQMAYNKAFTNPALLAGLWVFLSMLEVMQSYSQQELDSFRQTAQRVFGKDV